MKTATIAMRMAGVVLLGVLLAFVYFLAGAGCMGCAPAAPIPPGPFGATSMEGRAYETEAEMCFSLHTLAEKQACIAELRKRWAGR